MRRVDDNKKREKSSCNTNAVAFTAPWWKHIGGRGRDDARGRCEDESSLAADCARIACVCVHGSFIYMCVCVCRRENFTVDVRRDAGVYIVKEGKGSEESVVRRGTQTDRFD